MERRLLTLAMLAVAMTASRALATDWTRDTAPAGWYEPLTPEPLPALQFPAYFDDLDKASAEADAGRYKRSLQTLHGLKSGDAARIARVRAQDLIALGRTDEADATLSASAVCDDAAVQMCRAKLLIDLGRWTDAATLLQTHLAAHPDSLAGHWLLGQLHERRGQLDDAKSTYAWFVAPGQDYLDRWRAQHEALFNRADDAMTVGHALDRWAVLSGAYASDAQLNDTILDLFVKAYDVIDRGNVAAHVAAGAYLLSHDDADGAMKELQTALRANPNDPDAIALVGRIAVESFAFDKADGAIDALRREDPDSPQADLLLAWNLLRQRLPIQAEAVAARVVAGRPWDAEAAGLVAAGEALQLHDDRTAQLLQQIDADHPHAAGPYFDVAEQLSAMRQYPRAAAMYQASIERDPTWAAPRNGLGLLYTQSGDEDAARLALNTAHTLDPFDLETTNYLRLLDQLAGFERKESAHFIVEYDPKVDPIIPEYFNDYLEMIYPQVTGEYHTEPPQKTIIEVFPSHDAFSVRTTGSPWIGTVGASTGRIIAMVAPRAGENTQGPFNWSQVLRHEFTHTVTLAATDNRISHWMTEGLAVMEEHSPLQWAWVPMLYDAVSRHTLFDMDQLTWAFVRPKRPSDRQLAYAESFWVCTYIEQTYGHDVLLKMLHDFKDGGLQEQVFPRELNRTQEQFFSEFTTWTQKQVAGWGYDAESQKKYDALRDQGEELIQQRDYVQAVAVWEQIAAMRPVDELPHRKLAGLYLSHAVHEPMQAIEQLKRLHQLEQNNDAFAKRISRLYRDAGDLPSAEHYAMQAIYVDPYDLDAHTLMAEVVRKTGDQAALDREDRVIGELKALRQTRGGQ